MTCGLGLALDTVIAGHPGPAALAGGELLPNVLDLQPGSRERPGKEVALNACAMKMLGQRNSCRADPQLGQLQADYPPNTAPLGESFGAWQPGDISLKSYRRPPGAGGIKEALSRGAGCGVEGSWWGS